jgi:hypothetical protein
MINRKGEVDITKDALPKNMYAFAIRINGLIVKHLGIHVYVSMGLVIVKH